MTCECGPACENADIEDATGRYCDCCDREVHSLCVTGPGWFCGTETYACYACREGQP